MPDLNPITALGTQQETLKTIGALTIEENTGLALASLALLSESQRPEAIPLPAPGGWQQNGVISAFWTGQNSWMIEGAGKAETDFAAYVSSLAPSAAVTEQTDGWAAFEITSGEGAKPVEQLLEKLVNLDLRRFTARCATRTLLEHMTVFVIRRSDAKLAIIGMRSSAGTLFHAIETAARRIEVRG